MKEVKQAVRRNTPSVDFSPEGVMVIEGRSIMDDPYTFYNPLIERIYSCSSKYFTLEMRLEYINTSSNKLLLNLLNAVKKHFITTNILIKWYYESDDEDMLDLGKDIESIIHVPIDFYELEVEDN